MANTVEVKVDFIRQAYKEACSGWKKKIREEFPDLFSVVVFKVGDWVRLRSQSATVVKIDTLTKSTRTSKAFGWMGSGAKWNDIRYAGWTFGLENDDKWELVPKDEIQAMMLEECRKRGYKDGNFIPLEEDSGRREMTRPFYNFYSDTIFARPSGSGGSIIYTKGKWAEIKRTKAASDIIEEFKENNPKIIVI